MNNSAIGSKWKDVRKEIFTKEEILESDLRVALMGEIIKARHEEGLSQKKLEALSGVRQPVIARMEKGTSDPKLTTMIKILNSLGKTLAVVPIPIQKKRRLKLKAPFVKNAYVETKEDRSVK